MTGYSRKQMGKFSLSDDMIKHHPEKVADWMSRLKIIVVRAEYMYEDMAIHYTALCPLFKELANNEMIPEYKICIEEGLVNSKGDIGIVSINFVLEKKQTYLTRRVIV